MQPSHVVVRLTLDTSRNRRGAWEEAVLPRFAVVVLSLGALVVSGGPLGAGEAKGAIRLVWFDPTGAASGTEVVARDEVGRVLKRMGAAVSWRRSEGPEVIANGEVWVTLLGPGPQSASGPVVLGATGNVRSPSSVAWVRVPNVRAALGLPRGRSVLSLSPFERRQLAVAIGRVIAHEVVHARVPSLPHTTGLMSGTFNRGQLTAGSIPVETEVALALQAALRGDPVFAPWGTRVVAAAFPLQEKDRWDR